MALINRSWSLLLKLVLLWWLLNYLVISCKAEQYQMGTVIIPAGSIVLFRSVVYGEEKWVSLVLDNWSEMHSNGLAGQVYFCVGGRPIEMCRPEYMLFILPTFCNAPIPQLFFPIISIILPIFLINNIWTHECSQSTKYLMLSLTFTFI